MKFDTIIIGGGLSGLTCGISIAKTGRRVAIVSAGQNTLHFNGGFMELLGNIDGTEVSNPIKAINQLPDSHPYQKIGAERCAQLADQAKQQLADAGIVMKGECQRNHWRITPIGVTKPTWLSLQGMACSDQATSLPWSQVTLINLNGFIDLPINFLIHNLSQLGVQVTVKDLNLEALSNARRSATEMRSTSLARILSNTSKLGQLAEAINQTTSEGEVVLMPAIIGLDDVNAVDILKAQVKAQLHFLATLPPSVPGTRMSAMLKHYYKMLGGTYLLGDSVCKVVMEGNRVKQLHTSKLQNTPLISDHYVLASGSFMSQGLMSTPERIYEPLMELDVDAPADRDQWSHYGLLGDQPFMSCGVVTDKDFHALKGGIAIENLHVIGAILGGHNPVAMGDGGGVDMLTALSVAQDIIN